MKMCKEKMNEINKCFAEHSHKDIDCERKFDISLEPDTINTSFSDMNIIMGGHYICDLSSLVDLIEHLELLKQYVVESTGVYPWK